MKIFKFLVPSLLAFIFIASIPTMAQDGVEEDKKVSIRVLPERDAVQPGREIHLAIEEKIAEGWHVYWKNPGDSGEATTIEWSLPKGVTASAIDWPVPERIPFGPLLNFGYNGRLVLLTKLIVPPDFKEPFLKVAATIDLLVCQDICVPETTRIALDIPVTPDGGMPTYPEFFAAARKAIPETVAWQGMIEEAGNALALNFRPDPEILPRLAAAKSLVFFPEEWGLIQNAAEQKVEIGDGQVTFHIQRDTRPLSEVSEIKGVILADNQDGERVGFAVQTPVASIVAPAGQTVPPAASVSAPAEGNTTFAKALILALLGGLILNLMPCVFPVLSMKALSLIKLSDKEKSHAAFYGLSYTAGVLTCFGIIAAALIGFQQTGQELGWGFQLQNPVIVLILCYLLFLIGLNLSGYFEITGRLGNFGASFARRQGYLGTFFTGMLATVVATPCTAPFMGLAIGYALLQPPMMSLAIFLTLGFGLALPYLLLCLIPALRRALPRPGLWMETFRQFLAFPMFASAAWLIWVYGQQVESPYSVLEALSGIVLLVFSLWTWKRSPKRRTARIFIRSLAIACFLAALGIAVFSMQRMVAVGTMEQAPAASATTGAARPFTQAALDAALAGKNPVFVNMTAAWCITCKVNEQVALATDATRNLFSERNIVYFKGDWTNQNPEITSFLKKHGRNGVPLYVYYGPRDPTTDARPDAVILPQLLTPGLVADIVINQ